MVALGICGQGKGLGDAFPNHGRGKKKKGPTLDTPATLAKSSVVKRKESMGEKKTENVLRQLCLPDVAGLGVSRKTTLD